jgi:glycosyltransferase involved in cell wall biosynthesis
LAFGPALSYVDERLELMRAELLGKVDRAIGKVDRTIDRFNQRTIARMEQLEERVAARTDRLERVLDRTLDEVERRLALEAATIAEVVAARVRAFPSLEGGLAALSRDGAYRSAAADPSPSSAPSAPKLRAGMITPWNTRDAVSEYCRYLLDEIPDRAIEWTILAPQEESLLTPDGPNVVRCWRPRRRDNLSHLVEEIDRRSLELVHFQLEMTFFDMESLARAIRRLKVQGRRVCATFQRTCPYDGQGPNTTFESISDALRDLDALLVHTEDDFDRLAAWGLEQRLRRIPHGFPSVPERDRREVRAGLGIESSPVIGTFGFMMPRKRFLDLIEAFGILTRGFPEAVLLMMTALNESRNSSRYYHACLLRLAELGLGNRCAIVPRFLPLEQTVVALQAADVIAMPYQYKGESTSAAARLAIAAGRPLVTSRVPAFADLADETYQVVGESPAALAEAIAKLLTDNAAAVAISSRARQRAEREAWPNVARSYAGFLRELCR